MSNADTAVFLTARLHSSRLPKKMLIDIAGSPALGFGLARMRHARAPGRFVLCTSNHPDDEPLCALARKHGWDVFRGDEEDVLRRYLDAADNFGIRFFVNVDGDDLYCSVDHVDLILERFASVEADYIQCEGLPLGGAPIGLRTEALRRVVERKMEENTQGWGKYFTKSGEFRVETIVASHALCRPDYRMTLDYEEDLTFFRAVAEAVGVGAPLSRVIEFLDRNPDVAAISAAVNEQYWERFNREHGDFTMRSE